MVNEEASLSGDVYMMPLGMSVITACLRVERIVELRGRLHEDLTLVS